MEIDKLQQLLLGKCLLCRVGILIQQQHRNFNMPSKLKDIFVSLVREFDKEINQELEKTKETKLNGKNC